MFGYWYGLGPGVGVLGGLLMLLFWIAVVAFIIMIVRRGSSYDEVHRMYRDRDRAHRMRGWRNESALDILKERYAKGEIDKKEYEERKADLEK